MPRPTTKQELIKLSNQEFNKMWDLINSMSESEQESNFSFEDRDKNIRDVLIHLYEWHQLLLNWVNSNMKGDIKPFLKEPYNWKTYPEMNIEFWKQHQNTPYKNSIDMLKESHSKVMALIEKLSDEELFTKKYYAWTGTTNIGSYCISATSSHYDWAMKKIKNHVKNLV